MHTGGWINYSDDQITKEYILLVRELWKNPNNTHEQRMLYLAPMYVNCSENMVDSVLATIYESELRDNYRLLKGIIL